MNKCLECLNYLKERISDNAIFRGCIKDIEKKLKALEIIKNKNFDLFYLQDSKDLEQYNDCCDHFRNLCYLTQEEYDLLKEVII